MKQVVLLLLCVFLIGCLPGKYAEVPAIKPGVEIKSEVDFEEKLNRIFGDVDSSKILTSIGCAQGYFAHVSSEYVLRIPASIYSEYESSNEYSLSEEGVQCELLVFEKGDSNLRSFCTGMVAVNASTPKRAVKSVQGKMKVFFGNKEKPKGDEVKRAYIKIEYVEFIDASDSNRKIEIRDKYLWGVLNAGRPR